MNKAILWLAFGAALALPATVQGAPRSQTTTTTSTTAQTGLTVQQKLMTFLFGNLDTGQPGVECGEEDALNRPGHAENARGSAFNPDGVAGQHYAGEQPQNSKNPKSVSQYDVACEHAQSPR
jgi:hypothetical protein